MATRRHPRTTSGTQLALSFDTDDRPPAVPIPLVRAAEASPPLTLEPRRRARSRR
ncbi:hypothetical protein [Candidatus Protofrankia californiensis]|uniref:hypothetical protein n=1 Tax=Candidatus Protofrankia californiensis TaxID=1839754 RepID=UPI0013EB9706|nr:hypothetical protein [Candidatus Protofrankia californiensis]